ncbi:MAG: heme biosynthesis HemY N-terminal domain-containing protein [Pseudomonadota bacterium]
MIRGTTLLFVVLIVVALGAMGFWLAGIDGAVELTLPNGTTSGLPLGFAILGGTLLAGLVAVGWWIFAGLVTMPWTLGKARRAGQVKKANRALAEGLLAAEAGDAKTALKLAKKAGKHADDDRLKLLLEARAAEAGEDWSEAERAWGQLMRLPGGQLAGLRGAAASAIERGDTAVAEARARAALELKSGADWPFNSLFDLQVSQGRWAAALDTLALAGRGGGLSGRPLARRRAVLLTAKAANMGPDERHPAQRALAEAIKSAPDFPPAAWYGARHLMVDGKLKSAQNVLELAWKARPHPALAQLSRRLDPEENSRADRVRLEGLIKANPGHRESRILKAELAMEAGAWTDAVRELALLIEEKPTARLSLLMQRALTGYGDAGEAERWSIMAATAAREADWSDIDPQGGAFDFSAQAWSRLVYAFGDTGALVHPRYEDFSRELEAGKPIALPKPTPATAPSPTRDLNERMGSAETPAPSEPTTPKAAE